MNRDILIHNKVDPNAASHQVLGFVGATLLTIIGALFGSVECAIYGAFLGSLVVGVLIEAIQRVQRIGGVQNTLKESYLDVMITWLWFLSILRMKQ